MSIQGVVLFFALSAFTIARSTNHRRQQGEKILPNFYIRRAFRIIPMWWIFLTVWLLSAALIPWFGHFPTLKDIVLNFVLLFGFFPEANFTTVGWSLFVEELFYIAFPLLFPLLRRNVTLLLVLIGLVLVRHVWLSAGSGAENLTKEIFVHRFPLNYFYVFAVGLLAF